MLFPDRQNRGRTGILPRETKRRLELAAYPRLDEAGEEDGEGKDAGDDDADVDFGDSRRISFLVFISLPLWKGDSRV